jgi:hypothetical protein
MGKLLFLDAIDGFVMVRGSLRAAEMDKKEGNKNENEQNKGAKEKSLRPAAENGLNPHNLMHP